MRRSIWLALGGGAAITAASMVSAYSVQPMIYQMTPSGTGSTVRLTVSNPRQSLLNVELEPYAVTADEAGKRSFTPAPDDFLIFPPQASIAGDKTQLFQVRYVGAATMAAGRPYVVRVKQTNTTEAPSPDPAAKVQTKLALALNFNTTAIVQPRDLTADVVVERDLAADGAGLMKGRIVNRGKGVADLSRLSWNANLGGKTEAIPLENIRYGDAVFLEPGHSRDITVSKLPGAARLIVRQPGGKDGAAGRS